MAGHNVCEDLVRERKNCTFDVQELTHLIDGGPNETKERKDVEELVCSDPRWKDPVPEEYLSHKERYENSIRKGSILFELMRKYSETHSTMDAFQPTNKYRVTSGVVKDMTPFMIHMGMFVPTLLNQSNDEQRMEYLQKAVSMEIVGSYAQTELGHGTFVRGLETTATYDPDTEEFVLHSPTLASFKWWPGGLGQTANHCIVVAQLYSKGQCHGVHSFLVQIRDKDTHIPYPGIKVGDIGPKLGFQTANNGYIGFEHFRIPRTNMFMKNAQVLKDGTYIKSKNEKLSYGTMVFVRVILLADLAFELSRAATIAVRYSAVRHQSQLKADQPEVQIIDYVTQQHKLFIGVVTSHVFRVTGHWLWNSYSKVISDMKSGNLDQLPEFHALSCCLKAVCSRDAANRVDELRLACGGHGYMTSSNLPIIHGIVSATITYEGEYTVLLLQTARFLMKAWANGALGGQALTPTVSYLTKFVKTDRVQWANTPDGIVNGFQAAAAGTTKTAYETIQKYAKSGKDYEDAWNSASVQLVNASEAHCRAILCQVSWTEMGRLSKTVSPKLGKVLLELAELYLVYWTLEKRGDLLMYTTMSKEDIVKLQARYEELLALLRPNAIGIVDGFDIRDEILNSTLGAYDGRVYERLMEEAQKSPLNAEPVNQSFHKYLKPLMTRAKL